MALTYDWLDGVTLGGTQATITFSNIPQTYTDLIITVRGTTGSAGTSGVNLRVGNGSVDTGTNYLATQADGDVSKIVNYYDNTDTSLNIGIIGNSNIAQNLIHIQNYTNTNMWKVFMAEGGNIDYIRYAVGHWRSTAAINIIEVRNGTGIFAAGTNCNLFGIKAA